MEFKGTKGNIEIVEHSWSDTSLMIGDKQIAFKSIYDEATEENQEDLGAEVMYNFLLLSKSKEMLDMLIEISRRVNILKTEPEGVVKEQMIYLLDEGIEQLIKQATEL